MSTALSLLALAALLLGSPRWRVPAALVLVIASMVAMAAGSP